MKRFLWLLVGPAIIAFVLWRWLPRGEAPELGIAAGRLSDCPDSPNAVSSFASDSRHAIAPLYSEASFESLWMACRRAALAEPGARLVEESPGYMRLEMTTRWWRFIDDIEFLAAPAENWIHVRSASRVGYSDLGTNRRRVERIRARVRLTSQVHDSSQGTIPASRLPEPR